MTSDKDDMMDMNKRRPSDHFQSRQRSRSRGRPDGRPRSFGSGSPSPSPVRNRRRSESPRRRVKSKRSSSRGRSRSHSRERRKRRRSYSRSRSRSRGRRNDSFRRRDRPHPNPCDVLGVFGLSGRTKEQDLEDIFRKYGPLKKVTIIYDLKTGESKRFGFISFENVDDATKAKDETNGIELHGREIRVDYSLTTRPHSPTPGYYKGRRRSPRRYHGGDFYRRGGGGGGGGGGGWGRHGRGDESD